MFGLKVRRAPPQRRILVVGGGPAGLQFADTAAGLGHDVHLWDKGQVLGGQVLRAGGLPGHTALRHLIEDLSASLARRGVRVELGRTATLEAVRDLRVDRVVLACGARWQTDGFSTLRPDRAGIPRAPGTQVLNPVAVVDDPEQCGGTVLVLDDLGDYVGLGIARLLAARGRRVTLVTAEPMVGRRLEATAELPWVMPQVLAAGIALRTATFVESIDTGTVAVQGVHSGAAEQLRADTVVLCMQRRAETDLYDALQAAGIASRRIGDCLAPRAIDDAVLEGFREAHAC